MSKYVWAVEQGDYSDYRVVGVFSSSANAQFIADTINGDDTYYKATVTRWPIDPAVDELRAGQRQYRILMLRDGTVESCEAQSMSSYDIIGTIHLWHRTEALAYANKPNVQDCLDCTVWAKDEKHAIKIANEHRAQFIAANKW